MKKIIFFAILVIGFASCDTTSTATGKETQADTTSMNKMSMDSSKMGSPTDSTTMKKDTLPK